MKVEGLLFDYGGTIDTNGEHWFEKFRKTYNSFEIKLEKETFLRAYVQTEKRLADGIIKGDMNFRDVLKIKFQLHEQFLIESRAIRTGLPIKELINKLNDEIKENINENKKIFAELKRKYKLGIVSNFYGNIDAVLKGYGIYDFFDITIDSTLVGIRKPDKNLYSFAIEKLGIVAGKIIVIGDSYKNDIEPAKSLGCKTIWLNSNGYETEACKVESDFIIDDLKKINDVLDDANTSNYFL